MSIVYPTFDGFVGRDGGTVHLQAGEAWDSEHPLVKDRPELFGEPEATEPAAPRRGRPPGSRNKPKPDGGTDG